MMVFGVAWWERMKNQGLGDGYLLDLSGERAVFAPAIPLLAVILGLDPRICVCQQIGQ